MRVNYYLPSERAEEPNGKVEVQANSPFTASIVECVNQSIGGTWKSETMEDKKPLRPIWTLV